jgi:hypothetical protein
VVGGCGGSTEGERWLDAAAAQTERRGVGSNRRGGAAEHEAERILGHARARGRRREKCAPEDLEAAAGRAAARRARAGGAGGRSAGDGFGNWDARVSRLVGLVGFFARGPLLFPAVGFSDLPMDGSTHMSITPTDSLLAKIK